MDGTQIFILALGIICIVMMYVVLWWPAATVGALLVVVCTWGTIFGNWDAKLCEYTPDDPACVEHTDR